MAQCALIFSSVRKHCTLHVNKNKSHNTLHFCTYKIMFICMIITKHSSALYIGMAKVLPIIDVLGYDGQNS